MEALAKLGGWCGRKQTPIGPTMLIRGALLFIGAMQLIQLHTQKDLFAMARTQSPISDKSSVGDWRCDQVKARPPKA